MNYEIAVALRNAPEMYQDIPNYSKYLVSNYGNVMSKKTKKILKPYLTNRGYLTVGFWVDKKKRRLSIHRLVASAFLENLKNLPEVNHLNGTKTDNNLCNLEWASGSTNVSHAFQTGLHQTKLSRKMALRVRELRSQGNTLRETGKILGVSHSTIWEIEKGLIWKHIA
ncbi:MAG: NUMOD4 domain-containing protein [Cyanobacteria bacterium P01_A01_bin.84]